MTTHELKSKIQFSMHHFQDLSSTQVYKIIQAREEVFIEEQGIVYCDCDDKDQNAWHIIGVATGQKDQVLAYFRLLPPGVKGPHLSIGRVLTHISVRRLGYGKLLMKEGIRLIETNLGNQTVEMSAQAYLEKFYNLFGFTRCSDNYMEQGIPHCAMVRKPS